MTALQNLAQRAEVLNADAKARRDQCPTSPMAAYDRCVGDAYEIAMANLGWPNVVPNQLGRYLAVVGEQADNGQITHTEADLHFAQSVTQVVSAGAEVELGDAQTKDEATAAALASLGAQPQAQDQLNRAKALEYDRNNAIRSLGHIGP